MTLTEHNDSGGVLIPRQEPHPGRKSAAVLGGKEQVTEESAAVSENVLGKAGITHVEQEAGLQPGMRARPTNVQVNELIQHESFVLTSRVWIRMVGSQRLRLRM